MCSITLRIMDVMVRCNIWDYTRVELQGHGVITFISIPNFLSPQLPKFNVHTCILFLKKKNVNKLRFLANVTMSRSLLYIVLLMTSKYLSDLLMGCA